MRDDIHRKLPLTSRWKRVVKACTLEAEAPLRPAFVARVLSTELRRIRLSLIASMREQLAAGAPLLFPADVFGTRIAPKNRMEESLIRECQALAGKGMASDAALLLALERSAWDVTNAVRREIRAQVSLKWPNDVTLLLSRFDAATSGTNFPHAILQYLDSASPLKNVGAIDLDAELRRL